VGRRRSAFLQVRSFVRPRLQRRNDSQVGLVILK
jgi:hypothetical protein